MKAAKAYAATAGAVVTAVLATQAPGSTLFTVLTIVGVALTTFATYQIPNA